MYSTLKKAKYIILAAALSYSAATLACSAFVKNDSQGYPVFTKVRDASFGSHAQSDQGGRKWFAQHQEAILYHNDGIPFVGLYYGQLGSYKPDLLSTGINQDGISVTYNYDAAQKNTLDCIGSIAQDESDLALSILSTADSMSSAEQIVSRYVKKNNAPMLLTVSSLNDKQAAVFEIAISNPSVVQKIYDKTDGNTVAAKAAAQLTYSERTTSSNTPVYITNHFTRGLAQYNNNDVDFFKDNWLDSVARYQQFTHLMSTSDVIQTALSPSGGYSPQVAVMFAHNYPMDLSTIIYRGKPYDVSAEKDAVFREESRSLFLTSWNNDTDSPELFVVLSSPAQIYNRASFVLNEDFWTNPPVQDDGKTIIRPNSRYVPSVALAGTQRSSY
jgi:hypothetical protein